MLGGNVSDGSWVVVLFLAWLGGSRGKSCSLSWRCEAAVGRAGWMKEAGSQSFLQRAAHDCQLVRVTWTQLCGKGLRENGRTEVLHTSAINGVYHLFLRHSRYSELHGSGSSSPLVQWRVIFLFLSFICHVKLTLTANSGQLSVMLMLTLILLDLA